MIKTLIITDVQHDFMPSGALKIAGSNAIVPVINAILPKFDHVLAVRDWHPPHHVSFASTHHNTPGEMIQIGDTEQILWPNHCIQYTRGAELVGGLQQKKIEMIFHKGKDPKIDSYSAFFDNDHRHSTGLLDYLHKQNLTNLYFCGLTTDYCVLFSVLDAIKLHFKATVIVDACCAINRREGDGERALEKMEAAGAKFLFSKDI
jgi:nicotinamidase/pyrazinamidase